MKRRIIHIKRTITRVKGYEAVIGDTTKTYDGLRDLQMNDVVYNLLQIYLDTEYQENPLSLLFYNFKTN